MTCYLFDLVSRYSTKKLLFIFITYRVPTTLKFVFFAKGYFTFHTPKKGFFEHNNMQHVAEEKYQMFLIHCRFKVARNIALGYLLIILILIFALLQN